jgi:hypothetical protein
MTIPNTKIKPKKEFLFVFNQPAGYGDVFFLQKIAHHITAVKNSVVLWPLHNKVAQDCVEYIQFPDHCYVCDSQLAASFIKEAYSGYTISNEPIILDFQGADRIYPGSVMEAKYKYVGADWSDWSKFFNFKRNKKKEDTLYYDMLGLKDDTEYAVINNTYGTPPGVVECIHMKDLKLNVPNFKMEQIDGFTIFDWCKVFQNAREIHTVETCFHYLIEKMDNIENTTKLYAYSRHNPPYFGHVQQLFKKPWIWVT